MKTILATLFVLALSFTIPPEVIAASYYVSKDGNNNNGTSWSNAWNELDQIEWNQINPGDTILLDGGNTSQTYTTTLRPESSGTSTSPITIKLSDEPNRNGKVIIFGGRSTPLPYCGQIGYNFQTEGVNSYGMYIDGVDWLIIDGTKWSGITIHGNNHRGMRFEGSNNITVRNLEIYDNGRADEDGPDLWNPDSAGIEINGANNTFEYMLVHDNGQDAFQSPGDNLSNLTIRNSWMYNSRIHPNKAPGVVYDQSFNYCSHSDSLQIHNGGVVSGITLENNVHGPGFTNTLLLGDSGVDVNDVTLRDVLLLKANDNNLSAHSTATVSVKNWLLERVTIYAPNTTGSGGDGGRNLYYKGSGITIRDSIFVGSNIYIPNTTPTISGNCQWNTTGYDVGPDENPLFANAVPDAFSDGNYTVGNPNCKGSNLTSVAQLLGNINPQPTSIPTNTPFPTKGPTNTPTPLPTSTPKPGDTDKDNDVDILDLNLITNSFGQEVNIYDFNVLIKSY